MRKRRPNLDLPSKCCALSERDLHMFIGRMSCVCAKGARDVDAPLARAMFHQVEVRGHSPDQAARTLGIGRCDGIYLLAGLRREIATKLALVLLAELLSGRTDGSG